MLRVLLFFLVTWVCFPAIAGNSGISITLGVHGKTDSSFLLSQRATPMKRIPHESDNTCKVRFGVRSGVGLSNTNFNKGYPKPSEPMETVWRTGFTGGLLLEIPLYKKLFLQQEYSYAYLRGEAKGEKVRYSLSYLSLPVLMKLKVIPKLALVAGPQFDLLVQAKESHDGSSIDITHGIEERNISAVAGVEYKLSNKIGVDARFAHSVNHIGLKQGTITQEFKLESVQLAINFNPFQ